ncbi:FAD-dependent oxidoreductase [Nocardiopsis potens]|uniref:FAD-dependent oxidoreductase n=1 Tax=Nocardiopsis potens TaxID=1246458 RepID=UPI00034992D3|nr:FAD-dependent monooxygenase [Nocardiopsis potens]
MKVLIIGAGIAGPVTAAALGRAGIEAAVYEAHDGPAEHLGSFLNLAPNGLAVLRSLGMLGTVLESAVCPSTAIEFANGSGRRLGRLEDGSTELEEGLQTVLIMRGALQARLAEAAAAQGARLEYGKRLTGFERTGSGVSAHFADGTRAEGDVLLGADGLHSPVRTAMDPGAPAPDYTGLLNFGGVAHGVRAATPPGTVRMVYGSRAFFGLQTAPGGAAYWFANLPHPEPPRGPEAPGPEHWRALLLERFAGDLPEITEVLSASPVRDFTAHGTYDIASLPRWCDGPVGLLGDAAHAVSSSSGQGASMAIEDAATVARCLRDVPGPAEALRCYERVRRDRVERVVAEGRRRGAPKLAAGRLQVLLRDLMLPVLFRTISLRKGHSWMFDHRIDFDRDVREQLPA